MRDVRPAAGGGANANAHVTAMIMLDSHLISGRRIHGEGAELIAFNPFDASLTFHGKHATPGEIDQAVMAAREAFEHWADLPASQRIGFIEAYGEQLRSHRTELVEAICKSTGKPRWESNTEVDAMVGKVGLTIQAFKERRPDVSKELPGNVTAATRYKPHGVCAVFGPFNFPGHLPNGHILPALLSGNTIVFKPSEQTPHVGTLMAWMWQATGAPAGTFNLVQGGRETGSSLASHDGVDGIFFTGSFAAGTAISRANVENPGKILALEMGGNNPLLIHKCADHQAAAYNTIQSAFITAGQRCSCARRLILLRDVEGDAILQAIVEMTRRIVVGPYTQTPEPFMGPVISEIAGEHLLDAQQKMIDRGAKVLIQMKQVGARKTLLSPGILDITGVERSDVENFGPLLSVIRVDNLDEAMREANNTRYGLSAALFSDDAELWTWFCRKIHAGVVNWNKPTTGASGALPFGGVGNSGNHRPSAYFAVDYCNYPVAVMEEAKMAMPKTLTPGLRV
jgi:succinylglutamic semialdehyde dehydrogenase